MRGRKKSLLLLLLLCRERAGDCLIFWKRQFLLSSRLFPRFLLRRALHIKRRARGKKLFFFPQLRYGNLPNRKPKYEKKSFVFACCILRF